MGTRSVLKIPVHNEKSPLMINLILYLNPTLIVQYFKTELRGFKGKVNTSDYILCMTVRVILFYSLR